MDSNFNNSGNYKLYKRLLKYVYPYYGWGIVMVIATVIYSSTNAIYVSQLKVIIDEGFIKNDFSAIYFTITLLIFVTLLRGVGYFISNYTSRRVSSDIVLNIRKEMFTNLQKLPSSFFDKNNTGSILSRFNYDVLQVTEAATSAVIIVLREGSLIIFALSFLLYENWKLTLLIFTLAPIIFVIIRVISKRLQNLSQNIQGNMGSMNHILDENIKGQQIVKVYSGQDSEKQKFNSSIQQIRNSSIKSEVTNSLSSPIIELMIVIIACCIIVIMAFQAKAGYLTPGSFMSYLIMMMILPSPVKKIVRVNEYIQRGFVACKSIFNFLDENKETSNNIINKISGEIDFNNIYFYYDNQKILSNFNLNVKKGETIALVGRSGCGKSSLASLIPKFYDARSGSITIDGVNIKELDLQHLRANISFVNQDTILFDDTVINNIAYGDKNIDLERVKEAAKLAYADDFILKLKNDYNSVIGEEGQRLSGGQKQRLAIARAIYKNAPILILDEASSALDSESEEKVQMAINKLIKNKTAIIIAHRLSTIKDVDKIFVMDSGRIIESGSHQDLINNKDSKYYSLYNS